MAKKIKKNVKIIENQRGELWAMFEGMSEGVMVLDSKGRILHVNPALSGIFPRAQEFIGRAPLEATMSLEIQNLVDAIMAGERSERVSRQIELKNRHCAEMTVVPFRDHKYRPRVILVFHDTSEQKRVERVLRDFVANASHQLRTPLTSIRGYAEDPARRAPGRRGQAARIPGHHPGQRRAHGQGHRRHVRPGQERARGQALKRPLGQRGPGPGPRPQERLLRGQDKNIEIVLEPLPEGLPPAAADPDGILQIVDNILDNAIKYSPENTKVGISASSDGQNVILRIQDQGPGIAPDDQKRVFERFFRADNNGVDGEGSAGLGLAICRHIARNYGGEVWVDSPADQAAGTGSVFTVRLPVA